MLALLSVPQMVPRIGDALHRISSALFLSSLHCSGDGSQKLLPSGPFSASPLLVEQSIEAGLAAGVAAFVSHPLDSARTRTQAAILPKVIHITVFLFCNVGVSLTHIVYAFCFLLVFSSPFGTLLTAYITRTVHAQD